MGYSFDTEMCDHLTYTREQREALTEAFQALACGPEVERPVLEYADYDAFEFLDAEGFSVTEDKDGGLVVDGLCDSSMSSFLEGTIDILSINLGEDKEPHIWILCGEDMERWAWVFKHGKYADQPKMEIVYKVHVSDADVEERSME